MIISNIKKLVKVALFMIWVYQKFISPMLSAFFGPNSGCRFYPSCSEYGKNAFIQHGFFKGFYFTFLRILRCHPFHPGGHDPLPPKQIHFKN